MNPFVYQLSIRLVSLAALSALVWSLAAAAEVVASQRAILVLDASGSMWGQLNGTTKIEIARETVAAMTAEWPSGAELGLVAYGHREKGNCADIETLIAPGRLDRPSFLAQVNALNPKGKTPLSASVRQAAQALKFSEEKATVILVSDGEETCDLDPCAIGQELEQLGLDFTTHVVGFDINKPEHQAQLRCLAENTGGHYFNARDAQELSSALNAALAVTVKPAPVPATASLTAVDRAPIASRISIEWVGPADAGDYIAISAPQSTEQEYLNYTSLLVKNQAANLRLPSTAGIYELRYLSPIRTPALLARQMIEVVDVQARIEAPAQAYAGGQIEFTAEGPAGESDWIGFAPVGSATSVYLNGYYMRPSLPQTQAQLAVPGTPGQYELRYVLNEDTRILARAVVEVVAMEVLVQGPAEAMAGDLVDIDARGPASERHWIGFAPAGSAAGAYLANSYDRPQGEVSHLKLQAPHTVGDYELRYILNESESIAASQPIRITAAQAHLELPARLPASTEVEVRFGGPRGGSHWIGFVPRGETFEHYQTWTYTPAQSPAHLNSPTEAGAYDVVYVFVGSEEGDRELARVPVDVTIQ